MSEYVYLIHESNGTCLYLSSGEGPREEPDTFQDRLERQGFHHEEERPLGGGKVLRVYKRAMPATDIVPPDNSLVDSFA